MCKWRIWSGPQHYSCCAMIPFGSLMGKGRVPKRTRHRETEKDAGSEVSAGQSVLPNEEQLSPLPPQNRVTQARSRKKEELQPTTSGNCTFSGIVPIALQRFEQSGVSAVECPGCGRVWTLSPSGGVLRFKSHPKRKTNTPNTGRRWVRGKGETDWDVLEG